MSDGALKFVLDLEQKISGLEKSINAVDEVTAKIEKMTSVVDKLEAAQLKIKVPKALKETEKQVTATSNAHIDLGKRIGKTSAATLTMEQDFKSAREELNRLKAPAALKKIRDEIEAIHNPLRELEESRLSKITGGIGEGMFGGIAKLASGVFIGEAIMGAFRGVVDLIGSAIKGLVDLGKKALETAGHQEKVALSFKQLLGDAPAGELLGYLDKLSTKTGVNGEKLQQMARDFLASGAAAEEIRPLMAGALDMASLLGGSEAAVERSTRALSDMMVTGRATDDVFKALRLTEQDAFASIMESTGKNLKDVKELMGQGKIAGKDITASVLGALQRKTTGGKLGEFADQAGQTLEARLMHLQDIPTRLFQGLADGPAFAQISTFIDKLQKFFDPSSPIGAKLEAALNRVFDALASKLGNIDLEKFSTGLIDFLDKLPGRVERLVEVLGKLMNLASPFLKAAGGSGGETGFAGKALDNGLDNYASGLGVLANPSIGGIAGQVWKEIKGLGKITGLSDPISGDTLSGLAKGMNMGAKGRAFGSDLAAGVEAGYRDKAEIHSPSKVFQRLGEHTVEGFTLGVRGMHNEVQDSFRPMVDIMSPSLGAPSAPGGMMGGGMNFTVNVDVAGGGSARETAEEVARLVPMQIAIAFDRWREEFGV